MPFSTKNCVVWHWLMETPFATLFDAKLGISWCCILECLSQNCSAPHLASNGITKVLQCHSVTFDAIVGHRMPSMMATLFFSLNASTVYCSFLISKHVVSWSIEGLLAHVILMMSVGYCKECVLSLKQRTCKSKMFRNCQNCYSLLLAEKKTSIVLRQLQWAV